MPDWRWLLLAGSLGVMLGAGLIWLLHAFEQEFPHDTSRHRGWEDRE